MGTVGERKLGIGLVKRMGEGKDVYAGETGPGEDCVGYVFPCLLHCCSKHGNHPFFVPAFPPYL